jgi:hypothetical protein
MSLLNCKSQIDNDKLLQAFVNDSDFCKYIIPCKKCDTIYIIDTLSYFKNTPDFCKKIVVTKEFIKRTQYPKNNVDLIRWSCGNLFITKITIKKNYYRIIYFHSPTNGLGFIEYRLRRKNLIKVKSHYGQL